MIYHHDERPWYERAALMAADGMQPADRGQCWRELAAHQQQQQQQEARSLSGRLGSLLGVVGIPLWDVLVSIVVSVALCKCAFPSTF
jgi:hypothetical protein